MWQEIIVGVIALAIIVKLLYGLYRFITKKNTTSGCSCSGCSCSTSKNKK